MTRRILASFSRAKLLRTLSGEQHGQLHKLTLLTEEHEIRREERLRRKLLEILPQHGPLIDHIFTRDEVRMGADEAARHIISAHQRN